MGVASVPITTSGRGNCKGMSSVAIEITLLCDVMRKEKNEHAKIIGLENGKHVTCQSE